MFSTWTDNHSLLIPNYLHKSGTNPDLRIRGVADGFSLLILDKLDIDDSLDLT